MAVPGSADLLQRALLHRRRVYLTEEANVLRDQAQAIWRRARALRRAGEDATVVKQLAMAAEELYFQIEVAIIAIADEVGEA